MDVSENALYALAIIGVTIILSLGIVFGDGDKYTNVRVDNKECILFSSYPKDKNIYCLYEGER